MYVDETMSPGQFHHPRFIGERGGRQQQCLVGENSVRSTGWSTGSLAENAAGRVAKLHFARACGMRSSKRSPLYSRLSCPSSRRKRSRVSPCRKSLGFWSQNGAGSRRFFPKKVYYGGAPGLESGKIEKDNISITYALPFSRTIPVRTPQSASRTEVSRPLCHGRAPLTAGRTSRTFSMRTSATCPRSRSKVKETKIREISRRSTHRAHLHTLGSSTSPISRI